jgi:hypothetical protein
VTCAGESVRQRTQKIMIAADAEEPSIDRGDALVAPRFRVKIQTLVTSAPPPHGGRHARPATAPRASTPGNRRAVCGSAPGTHASATAGSGRARSGKLKTWKPRKLASWRRGRRRQVSSFPGPQVSSAPRPATASNWTRNSRERRRARYTAAPWGQLSDGRAGRARGREHLDQTAPPEGSYWRPRSSVSECS